MSDRSSQIYKLNQEIYLPVWSFEELVHVEHGQEERLIGTTVARSDFNHPVDHLCSYFRVDRVILQEFRWHSHILSRITKDKQMIRLVYFNQKTFLCFFSLLFPIQNWMRTTLQFICWTRPAELNNQQRKWISNYFSHGADHSVGVRLLIRFRFLQRRVLRANLGFLLWVEESWELAAIISFLLLLWNCVLREHVLIDRTIWSWYDWNRILFHAFFLDNWDRICSCSSNSNRNKRDKRILAGNCFRTDLVKSTDSNTCVAVRQGTSIVAFIAINRKLLLRSVRVERRGSRIQIIRSFHRCEGE